MIDEVKKNYAVKILAVKIWCAQERVTNEKIEVNEKQQLDYSNY